VARARKIASAYDRNGAIFVGNQDVCHFYLSNVSNHPQRLWISLWAVAEGELQVAHRKGLFFGRSKIERRVFH
jgi:hypothetical protein